MSKKTHDDETPPPARHDPPRHPEIELAEKNAKVAQRPTVGRIVHFYRDDAAEPVPGVIYRVSGNVVDIFLFGHVLLPFAAPYSDGPKPNHWTWPPRV